MSTVISDLIYLVTVNSHTTNPLNMSLINLATDICVLKVQEQMGRPSKEVIASGAGPALANAALLLAQGRDPTLYIQAITRLYEANRLPCPDLTLITQLHH